MYRSSGVGSSKGCTQRSSRVPRVVGWHSNGEVSLLVPTLLVGIRVAVPLLDDSLVARLLKLALQVERLVAVDQRVARLVCGLILQLRLLPN